MNRMYLLFSTCLFIILVLVGGFLTKNKYIFSDGSEKVLSAKTYSTPLNFTLRPAQPEIVYGEGKTISKDRITAIVLPDTVEYDSYLSFGVVPKNNPISIGKYWQVSHIYDICLRSFHNNAKILYPSRQSILSISYKSYDLQTERGIYLPEDSLKIVRSTDNGISWKMLRSSVVNKENKTVGAITNLCGGYMLVSGFVNPKTFFNYKSLD